jgi:hypothetical protein
LYDSLSCYYDTVRAAQSTRHPMNAILNYAYVVLESQVHVSAVA